MLSRTSKFFEFICSELTNVKNMKQTLQLRFPSSDVSALYRNFLHDAKIAISLDGECTPALVKCETFTSHRVRMQRMNMLRPHQDDMYFDRICSTSPLRWLMGALTFGLIDDRIQRELSLRQGPSCIFHYGEYCGRTFTLERVFSHRGIAR
jgi:hypothetical protein